MAVFTRTEEGQDAAYSPHSALPRKLKSILKVIDGRTSMATFEKNLSSFGDVEAILKSLQMAGLIRQIEQDTNLAQSDVNMRSSQATVPVAKSRVAFLPQWAATRIPRTEQPGNSTIQTWQSSEMVTQLLPQEGQPPHAVLQDILDTMSNFVLTHLPGQSFQILKEIEEISSLELLAVTLGGYEQMVASVGEASVQHLKNIKHALRNNL